VQRTPTIHPLQRKKSRRGVAIIIAAPLRYREAAERGGRATARKEGEEKQRGALGAQEMKERIPVKIEVESVLPRKEEGIVWAAVGCENAQTS